MVNDHFVLWPWRPHELYFNSPHILSFTAESIIKLAWIQFRHLHLGVMLVPWSYFSLDSCVSFLILSPYRTFGNSACLATLDSNVQSTNEFIKGILYFHYMFVKSPHSCLILCNTLDHSLPGSSNPGKNTGVGCSALLQGLSTQGLNPCLLCLLYWQADSLPLCQLQP